MGDRIKGITLKIGGDTTGLSKALRGINSEVKNTQSQLKDVDRLLKLDPGNMELLTQKQKLLSESIKGTKEKLDALKEANRQVSQSASNYDIWKEKYEPIKKQIDDTGARLNKLKEQTKDADRQLAEGDISQEKYDAIQEEIRQTSDELKELKKSAKDVSDEFGNPISPDQYEALQREIIETEQQLKQLEKTAGSANATFALISEKTGKFGKNATAAGEKMMPITAGIMAAGTASAVMASSFEDAMAKVSTIADETEVPIGDLEAAILKLSDETGIAAADIADNVYNAISAGQSTGDAVNFVSNATKLAKAGFAESGDALDILTTIMNAYGMEADQVTNVSDMLIQTQNLGKTTVAELSSAMGKVIPTAKAQGVELDSLCGAYAVMTSNGIATAETTTYLNSMLNELGKQGSTAAKAFAEGTEHIKEGGLTMAEAMEQGWTLTDVLSILDEQAYISGTSIANMFSSAEAGKAASVLWDNAERLNSAVEHMGNSAGATETAFGKLDTTSNQAGIALNQIKNAGIELGTTILEMLLPTVERIIEGIKNFTEWFKGLSDGQKELIVVIGMLVAAVGPLLTIVGKISSGISIVTGLLSKASLLTGGFGGALSALSGPLGIVAGGILSLIAVFVTLYNTNDEFRANMQELWEQIQEKISGVIEILKEVFSGFAESVSLIWDKCGSDVMEILQNSIDFIISTIENAVSMIEAIIKLFSSVFRADWEGAWKAAKQILSSAGKIIVSLGKTMFNLLVSGIKIALGFLPETVQNGFHSAIEFLKSLPKKALEWGKDFIQGLIDGIKSKISGIADAVAGVGEKIKSFLHFSRPDVGPLRDYETWMPDFMEGLSKGIHSNMWRVTGQITALADGMQGNIFPEQMGAGEDSGLMQQIMVLLENYLPAMAEQKYVLMDSKTLVGRISGAMDKALGKIQSMEERGV